MYFKTDINIKKIPKFCKKFSEKNLHCFSLFEVLYNWVKFRRLKMGDPVSFTTLQLTIEHSPGFTSVNSNA